MKHADHARPREQAGRRCAPKQDTPPLDPAASPTNVRNPRENQRELELLLGRLLIGVTSFLRDAPAWEPLLSEVIPALLKNRPNGASP